MIEVRSLLKDFTEEFIGRLLENFQVIAPVRRNGRVFYEMIANAHEADLEYTGRSQLPPKRFFLPEKEVLFTYEITTRDVFIYDRSEELEGLKRIFIGIRPCDIHSLKILDKIFFGKFNDPYYGLRRKNTLILGLTCNVALEYCFCVHMGSGPGIENGFDLLLTDLGDYYLVEIGSDKGRRLVYHNIDLFRSASPGDLEERRRILSKVESDMKKEPFPDLDRLYKAMLKNFEADMWNKYGESCLACGKCNFVCPTCICFDVYDDPNLDLKSGKRVRVWDSCHFISFTRVAGGLVFRKERPSRVKQRVYHKYCYSVDEIEMFSCVGCGRCIETCPVNINIMEIAREVTGL